MGIGPELSNPGGMTGHQGRWTVGLSRGVTPQLPQGWRTGSSATSLMGVQPEGDGAGFQRDPHCSPGTHRARLTPCTGLVHTSLCL